VTQVFREGSRHKAPADNGQGENSMNYNAKKEQHLIEPAQRRIKTLENVNKFPKATNSAHLSRKTSTLKKAEDLKLFHSNLKSILHQGDSTVQKFGPMSQPKIFRMGSENVFKSPTQIGWYKNQKNSQRFIGEATPKNGIPISLSPKGLTPVIQHGGTKFSINITNSKNVQRKSGRDLIGNAKSTVEASSEQDLVQQKWLSTSQVQMVQNRLTYEPAMNGGLTKSAMIRDASNSNLLHKTEDDFPGASFLNGQSYGGSQKRSDKKEFRNYSIGYQSKLDMFDDAVSGYMTNGPQLSDYEAYQFSKKPVNMAQNLDSNSNHNGSLKNDYFYDKRNLNQKNLTQSTKGNFDILTNVDLMSGGGDKNFWISYDLALTDKIQASMGNGTKLNSGIFSEKKCIIRTKRKGLAGKFGPRDGPQKTKNEECSEVIQKEKSYPKLKLEDLICDGDSLATGADINTQKNRGQCKPLGHPFNPTHKMSNRSVANLASPTRPNEYNFLDKKNFSDRSDGLGPENPRMQKSTPN
jgi:hypothetical protein